MQAGLWAGAAAAAALILASGLADRRRTRRRDLDRVGWVPWPLVQVTAIILAVVLAALAVKSG